MKGGEVALRFDCSPLAIQGRCGRKWGEKLP